MAAQLSSIDWVPEYLLDAPFYGFTPWKYQPPSSLLMFVRKYQSSVNILFKVVLGPPYKIFEQIRVYWWANNPPWFDKKWWGSQVYFGECILADASSAGSFGREVVVRYQM